MAPPKTLQLVSNEPLGRHGRSLEFESPEDLGFEGGQFLIVATGLARDDGSPLKRCYSIVSPDSDQRHVRMVIQEVGPGSRALMALQPGAWVTCSGPWGKLTASAQPSDGQALVVATDTGITAALGLLRGKAFERRLERTTLLWLDHEADALLTREQVADSLPTKLAEWGHHELPAVSSTDRAQVAREQVIAALSAPRSAPAACWLVGDGNVLFPVRDVLESRFGPGIAERASVECFFNNPERIRT